MIWLYRAPYSTNVERVVLALAHKGLTDQVESIVISYDDRTEVEEISGQGLVPVIDDEGTIVIDSARILRYLDERYPEPAIFPADPARRAEMDVFIEWFNEVWKGPPNTIEFELSSEEPDQDVIASEGARMQESLALFERMLQGRDFLMGDEVSAADFVAFPFLKYASLRDPDDDELFHRILDVHQQPGDDHPRLAAWVDRINRLPRA
ncbi:MAG TPA: glutathione S-transferase family protein [Solirubrobacterales bacterium]|nr:glutathione S-transferase family protein [Solirubrobacterales bacterium]